MEEKKKRIYWIDAAKIVAMFLIVLAHTIAYSEKLVWLKKYLNSFHVVLFFVISGYIFNTVKYKNYKEFFINKFKSTMVPYFVFATLFLIPLFLFGSDAANELGRNDINMGIGKSIIGIFYGNAHDNYLRQNSALWFLPCLFTLENIYYFIEKSKNKYKYLLAILISLLVGALDYYFLPIRLPWGLDIAFVMVFFFSIGKLLSKLDVKEIKKKNVNRKQIWLSLIFIICGLILQNFNGEIMYIHNYYSNYSLFIISATLSVIGYIYLIKLIPRFKFLQYAGQRTMSILIFHKIIVVLFQTKITPIANLLNQNQYWIVELFFALIVAIISIMLSLIADKIITYFCPEILGKKRERRIETK